MKKYILLFVALFSCLFLSAQKFSVVEFKCLENDMTAKTDGTRRYDDNGNLSALIKIETVENQWSFDVGMLGIVGDIEMQNEMHRAEIWVYVPFGVQRMTIQHSQYGRLDYTFPFSINKGYVYRMKLETPRFSYNKYEVTDQFLVFNVSPADAVVTVNGVLWPVVEGTAQDLVSFGEYEYRIEASEYNTEVGRVKVDDPKNKVVRNISLRPAFGFLKIEGDNRILSQASIYIDNTNGAEALRSAIKLSSGNHTVRAAHSKYKPYEQTVTIQDGDTCVLNMGMNADFSTVTVKVDDEEAEIWINNELKGRGSWTGDLSTGSYTMECRKKFHHSTLEKKTVTDSMSGDTLQLEAPIPITGTLVMNSNPPMAKIFIDDEPVGETPLRINAILIGEHTLRLEKKGYLPLTKTFTIEEGRTLNLTETLDNGRNEVVANNTEEQNTKVLVKDHTTQEKRHFRNKGFAFRPEVGYAFNYNYDGPIVKLAAGYQFGPHVYVGIVGGFNGFDISRIEGGVWPLTGEARFYCSDRKFSFVTGLKVGCVFAKPTSVYDPIIGADYGLYVGYAFGRIEATFDLDCSAELYGGNYFSINLAYRFGK